MAYFLSPVLNEQQFDANGNPLSGGKIYTYLAGTVTPVTTYKTSTGTAQANPIILDSSGNYPTGTQLWLSGGLQYKFVVQDSTGVTLRTIDNITGTNDANLSPSEWTQYTATAFSYLSGNSLSVVGDVTNTLQVNRRVKTQNTGGTSYGTILTSVYGAPNTTVTLTNTSGTLDAGLSAVYYGLLAPINPSIPGTYPTSTQIQTQAFTGFTTAGTTTAYTLTPSPALASLATGRPRFCVKFNAANTSTTPTLAVSGLAATALKVYDGAGAKQDPAIGAFAANLIVDVVYDGTHWVAIDMPVPPAATQAQVLAGSSTGVYISPAVNLATQLFSAGFESAQQVITWSSTQTIAHGLGRRPKFVYVEAVCLIAEFNYSIGDTVAVNVGGDQDASNRKLSVRYDATNIITRLPGNGIYIADATTGAANSMTVANWRLVYRAWA